MILELQNISFSFINSKNLLDNINLTLQESKIYALTGTNGSGKTTLFNLISGFIKQKSGSILFKEKDISMKSPYQINELGIGRTFQDLRIITKLTVKENILLAMKNNPTDKWFNALLPKSLFNTKLDKLNRVADNLINDYFLFDVKESLTGEISFGQQKLLTLACCVANGSNLLLLDEPIAGINPEYMRIISKLLLQLIEKGTTIFFIEHNTDFISEIANAVFFLDQGKIRQYNTIDEMASDKYVNQAYL